MSELRGSIPTTMERAVGKWRVGVRSEAVFCEGGLILMEVLKKIPWSLVAVVALFGVLYILFVTVK